MGYLIHFIYRHFFIYFLDYRLWVLLSPHSSTMTLISSILGAANLLASLPQSVTNGERFITITYQSFSKPETDYLPAGGSVLGSLEAPRLQPFLTNNVRFLESSIVLHSQCD
jgi:hypothetical protein